MIRFRMLGTLDLRDSQGQRYPSILRRPKLLALLAYLAIARSPGFHRRDTLVALLWPDLDHVHARNALRQAVHALREGLGRDAVLSRGDGEIAVNEERLRCDVRDFETSLEAGHAEQSLELYRGDLLNGLYVSGAPGFERWLDAERDHLRSRAIEAARLLIDRDDAAGNPVGAARWAAGLVELSPYDEAAVRRLIQLLDRTEDRAGAIRAYEEFERRLARDLDLQPSPQTQALAEGIRARRQAGGAARIAAAEATIGGERRAPLGEEDAHALGASRGATDDALGDAGPADSRAWTRRRRRVARRRVGPVVVLVVAGLLSGGWFFLRREFGAGRTEAAEEPKRIAVLPFANLGAVEDEYFADGITEEIAARLAATDRLQVIGRTSGNLYKRTQKTVSEIGAELGVEYVLEGSVRWQKSGDGSARVRVTPQLVSTADGSHLWAEVYDEPLDEIFKVQSDIAQKVVRALDVTLLERQRRVLQAAPTANLEAYDYYLRGNDYMHRLEGPHARAAVRMYDQAVELDPGFALAHARLGRIHSRIYWLYYDRSEERLELAKRALARAFELAPDLPQAHQALGSYYWLGYLDYGLALREYAIAEAALPNETDVLFPRAVLLTRQGKFREALTDFEKAWQLDPGSAWYASNYAEHGFDLIRDFERAEALYDRAIALSPEWSYPYFLKSGLYLRWEGSTQKARAVLEEARSAGVTETPLLLLARVSVEIFDRRYDEAIDVISSRAPEVIEDQFRFIPRAQLLAQVYGLMGRPGLQRIHHDSVLTLVSAKVREQPDDPRLHSALGIAYAGLGQKQEAIREGRKGVGLLPIKKEAYRGYYRAWDLARIYVMVGEDDPAIDQLEQLLSIPGHLTVAWLQIDPAWDSLRDHPRFRRLLTISDGARVAGSGSDSPR